MSYSELVCLHRPLVRSRPPLCRPTKRIPLKRTRTIGTRRKRYSATAAAAPRRKTLMLDPCSPISTLRIPFKSAEHADIARRVILVDRELNGHLVERTIIVEGNTLIAYANTSPSAGIARLLKPHALQDVSYGHCSTAASRHQRLHRESSTRRSDHSRIRTVDKRKPNGRGT